MQHSTNIVIAEAGAYSAQALTTYQQLGKLTTFISPDDAALQDALSEAHVLVVRLAKYWDAPSLQQAPQLQYIVSPTTGLDHIDRTYCTSNKITVLSLQGEIDFLGSIPSTAEHTWALLMACMRRVVPAANAVRQGEWNRNDWKGNNLQRKTIGIIGMGRVGKQVARFAQAFSMPVIAYDINPQQCADAQVTAVPLLYLLQESDVISIHIPGAGNDYFLSAELLAHCKLGAMLINTSRGNVWDESAVAALLEAQQLMAVATDVLHYEMTPGKFQESPLWQLARHNHRVLITPHIAGATVESMAATEDFMAEKLRRVLQQQR